MSPSYRNQSVDLQSNSADQFLYDGNIGRSKVKNDKFQWSWEGDDRESLTYNYLPHCGMTRLAKPCKSYVV